MKLVTRKQFMQMPAGTVFSYYNPWSFSGLNIKACNPNPEYPDFMFSNLVGGSMDADESKCEALEKGESVPANFEDLECEGRFDDDQVYAIYDKEDVANLVKRLTA